MARFTQYPAASTGDYSDATTFLIANEDGEVKQASLEGLRSIFGCNIQCASLTIPTAEVLALNSTPQTIVSAQGAGTAIEVISATMKLDYNSATYATNVGLQLICNGAHEPQVVSLTALNASVTSTRRLTVDSTFAATDTQLLENTALQVQVPSGDPVTGDSDIEVFVLYRVINV